MSTMVLISSSPPPRVFARSPTPARSSSPSLPSPSAILRGGSVEGKKRFKTIAVQRDGFPGRLTTATALMRTKVGAENVPIHIHRPQKTAQWTKQLQDTARGPSSKDHLPPNRDAEVAETEVEVEEDQPNRHESEKENRIEKNGNTKRTTTNLEPSEIRELSPLLLDKVPPHRLDWTPPHFAASASMGPCSDAISATSFPGDLLGSFGYNSAVAKESVIAKRDEDGGPVKRRRIDFVDVGDKKSLTSIAALQLPAKTAAKSFTRLKKRAKSPAKKYTTITGLATSHYRENELGLETATPMLQYLSATQARAVDHSEEPLPDTAKPKPTRPPRRTKKAVSKFKVLSPQSAMKVLDSQEMMFGSASQLARDESPNFMRDTLEAIKQSESFLVSDPFSTQRTQPISIESTTPRAYRGTARFAKTRNLWSAAGRDEDNALLHVDTIDLFDTPGIRNAFAGKDVLLEPGATRQRESRLPGRYSPSLRGGHLVIPRSGLLGCYDIDDITTPVARVSGSILPHVQSRGLYRNAREIEPGDEPKSTTRSEDSESIAMAPNPKATEPAPQPQAVPAQKPKPKKPLYTGFTTHDLQKQISDFGFKPIKKREKMIEILDRCWEDKHGPITCGAQTDPPAAAESVEALTHGDFLSKVHDISSRPVPKVVKKPRERPKKDEAADLVKSPRRRKKAEPKAKRSSSDETAKAPRKRKAKASAPLEEDIVDVDDIEDSAIRALKPATLDKVVAKRKRTAKAVPPPVPKTTRLIMHPPTLPQTLSSSSPAFQQPRTAVEPSATDTATNTPPTDLSSPLPTPAIDTQITRAIESYIPPPGHNHRTHPTWHERILMFDPIVLEDLAAWLNTEGLAQISEDREVSALEVRTWCETRGVCCLWKGGWRGNKANRGEED